jgi:4-amino-4-deoxy-L-arabinose transferase-like glycosyltransferase
MLDLPAIALGLAALNVYVVATERQSLTLAIAAGLLTGLAMQTKYTAFLVPGVMFFWSATTGRWRCWPLAVAVAVGLLVAWEWFIATKYGASHLELARQNDRELLTKISQLPFLFSHLGGLTVFGIGIGMAALGLRRSLVWGAVAVMLLSYVALIVFDVTFTSPVHRDPPVQFQLVEALFNGVAFVGCVVVVLTVWTLRRIERGDRRPETTFLLLWLGLEVAGFLLLAPFPAVRRVLGVGLVLSLLVARLAARRALYLWKRGPLRGLVLGSVVLGFAVAARDLAEARVQLQGAEIAAEWIAEQGGRGKVWYVGHWGFQFYAERLGMKPVVPRYDRPPDPNGPIPFPPATVFEPGDWIVVPSEYTVIQQQLYLDPACVEEPRPWNFGGALPVRTVRCYYDGRTPLEHREGPWLTVRAYLVRRRFEAVANP